jgi:signal transduction histidine kinase
LSDTSLRKDIGRIVAVITALSVLCAAAVLILTEQALARQRQDILDQKMTTASALAGRFQLRIEDATNVLQVAAGSAEFSTINNIDKVSDEYKGIPFNFEEDKRRLARQVLVHYGNFETLAFALPNGDIYFLEPYDRQLSLPRLNYADREWYRSPIETGEPYAADALISTATNHRVIPIAVPVYSTDGSSLVGIMVGAMDLEILEQQLRKELNLSSNNRVIYVDDKGNAIEDVSAKTVDTYAAILSLSHLQSVKNVNAGQTGYITEFVDNVEVLTVYRPAVVDGRNWGVLVMQPTADAYSVIDYLRNQSYAMLTIIIMIIAVAGYFLVTLRTNSTLSRQLARVNTELIEKDRLKDEFLKIASHELRTPIQPIIGYSSLGMRGMIKDQTAWSIVYKEAQRLMKLANNIVDITMIQSGIMTFKMEKSRIIEVVQGSVDSVRVSAGEKNLSLELNVDEQSQNIELLLDRSKLRRAFDEILENAIKFTQKGGITIDCRVQSETGELVIRITDTGTSIPNDLLSRVFDIFSSKSVNDPEVQGAGLGLFICRAFVKAHKGNIVARNNSDGTGATFEVRFPVQSVQPHETSGAVAVN